MSSTGGVWMIVGSICMFYNLPCKLFITAEMVPLTFVIAVPVLGKVVIFRS